jgi:hypothetical protein
MTITLTPDIEAAVADQARRQGTSPESLALDSLREKFVERQVHQSVPVIEPRDEWERMLASIAVDTGVSLTDEQLSREVMYEDHD